MTWRRLGSSFWEWCSSCWWRFCSRAFARVPIPIAFGTVEKSTWQQMRDVCEAETEYDVQWTEPARPANVLRFRRQPIFREQEIRR